MRPRLISAALTPVGLLLGLVILLTAPGSCLRGGEANPTSLSKDAQVAIPPAVLEIYIAQARRWNLDVAFLAAIGAQETNHGRHPTTNKVNRSGCQGLMQLGVRGKCGDYWGRNKCDGNDDGRMLITDHWDNICAAARGLRGEKGAPPAGGSAAGYHQAACNYYGACADGSANYASEVIARAELYGFVAGTVTDPAGLPVGTDPVGASCGHVAIAAGDDEFIVDPGANRPGVDLAQELVGFLRGMAEFLPRPPIVTTGSDHRPYTTSGNLSDHWDGHAVDLGSVRNGFPATGGGYGDAIAEAAFLAAGEAPETARAQAAKGGAYTLRRDGLRIQILWKTYTGGNHFNHIHIGVRPLDL